MNSSMYNVNSVIKLCLDKWETRSIQQLEVIKSNSQMCLHFYLKLTY